MPTETAKIPGATFHVTYGEDAPPDPDGQEVQPGLEEDYDAEEPKELGGPDGEFQPLG